MMYPGSEKFEFAYTVGDKIFVYGQAYLIHSVTIDANGRARVCLVPAPDRFFCIDCNRHFASERLYVEHPCFHQESETEEKS